jgi:hypothetical protein
MIINFKLTREMNIMRQRRFTHKAFLAILICSMTLFLISCGDSVDSGGGSDGGVIPPWQDIRGTYFLDTITLVYSDGIVVTQDDMNISGTMQICAGTIIQSFFIDGIPYELIGTYTVKYTNRTSEGYLDITESIGTYYLYFLISGNNLITYSGILPFEDGITYEEWDTWYKVDNYC